MNAVQFPAFDLHLPGLRRPAAQHHGVKLRPQPVGRKLLADLDPGDEANPFGGKQINAALNDLLIKLHVRDAVHQQPADTIRPFVHGHVMPSFVQLIRTGQPRRTGSHDRHLLTGGCGRDPRPYPAFLESVVDNGPFNAFDRHGLTALANGTRSFARRRADPAGKLGEIARLLQSF
ncbi:hypothetical protein D3C81_756990 [compost metagenome]